MRIEVTQSTGLVDERLGIHVHGLNPSQVVTLKAEMRDNFGKLWTSRVTFQANNEGNINVGNQQPITGTYNITDSMGLIWSMELQPVAFTQSTPLAPIMTKLMVEYESKEIAAITFARKVIATGVQRVPLTDAEGIIGTLFVPPGTGPHPGVIVLGGSEGGLMEGRAAMLASHGYAALAIAYFGKGDLPKQLIRIPIETVSKALAWMLAQRIVIPDSITVFGTSKGGELALLCAAHFPQIRRVVAFVPSGVVFPGIGSFKDGVVESSWTMNGIPFPFATGVVPTEILEEIVAGRNTKNPIAYRDWYLSQLSDRVSLASATIPVEKINGPILLVSGGDDKMWPSFHLADMVMKRLDENKHPFPYHHLYYPKAGHSFFPPYYSTTVKGGPYDLGGNPTDDALAQADSWSKTLEFLSLNN